MTNGLLSRLLLQSRLLLEGTRGLDLGVWAVMLSQFACIFMELAESDSLKGERDLAF